MLLKVGAKVYEAMFGQLVSDEVSLRAACRMRTAILAVGGRNRRSLVAAQSEPRRAADGPEVLVVLGEQPGIVVGAVSGAPPCRGKGLCGVN